MDILQVENLSFTYPGCAQKALDGISFSVRAGELVLVCGQTGCGKSTLLRMLKRELTPAGERGGTVRYRGRPLEALGAAESAAEIGFVLQRPEHQLVTDKVWHELAFGLENLGLPTQAIRRRVSEMASYFGISDWFEREVAALSGGQKQLLSLAAVMVMQPKLLILDEPTAQLDPIAAAEFIATLQKLCRELGLTILLAEHRLEEVFPIADRVLMLKGGRVHHYGEPRAVAVRVEEGDPMQAAMPCAVRVYGALEHSLWRSLEHSSPCPLTVGEGRRYVEESFNRHITALPERPYVHSERVALYARDVWFRYARDLPDVLRGLDLTVYENELFCILGGNASGKTTALSVLAGLYPAHAGKVEVPGKQGKAGKSGKPGVHLGAGKNGALCQSALALLPQDVQTVFMGRTVREDLEELGGDLSAIPFDISHLLARHPYDLSGGEQQLCALAKTLLLRPRILLLDEPTKGLDAHAKLRLIEILRTLKASGMTLVAVSHDVEFAAACADRCALFFRGEITSVDVPERFFAENNFYTTAANRMTRGLYDRIVTAEQAVQLLRENGRKQ